MGDSLDDQEQRLWRSFLYGTTHAVNALEQALQKQWQLPLTDYEILSVLSEYPDQRCRMSELAERVVVSRSRMTYRVDHLIQRGLVTREKSSEDGRGVLALLTESGEQLLESASVLHVANVRRFVTDHVDKHRMDEVSQMFDAMSRAAGQKPPALA